MLRIDILTIFPEFFSSPLKVSLVKKAIDHQLFSVNLHNLRSFALDKQATVDDVPFGGGPGMVLKPEPIFKALESLPRGMVILLSPQGRLLNQDLAIELSKKEHLIFICGRYEGIDERVSENVVDLELSIGDYILNGGEVAALVLVETVGRLIPGVLGNIDSLKEESFAKEIISYPQYTRPANYQGLEVPSVLRSGNHKEIRLWREKKALEKTDKNRKDLIDKFNKKGNI
ncbi:tRNA (guanosine(37)-N1)-methyltransferase TrmD [bacterium]|nr:tRNA (guanosine(37)-N1)-methyltransferase TrmD [bacterium]MBU0900183.1 tRNA (guanosine(37)-N1)-methyltransferase TrmD [bacterium]MBU1153472.1 tRNA (guanosine(37)-N1)-methyltransferase TrmD [bacterium]MBU2599038.1 tRNA (guanosine(37)-N1)-methyltransferase TrmD [bacterium]